MICVLKMRDGAIVGWIIGHDIFEIRDRADDDLLQAIRSLTEEPRPGKHELSADYVMLVQ